MLLLVALVLAAPRVDGFYVPEPSRAIVDGPATGPDELALLQTVTFTRTTVTVHFVLEDEVLTWKPGKAGLDVKPENAGWRQRTWKENDDGSVETSLLQGRLRFVPGSFPERLAAARRRFTLATLQRLAGTYSSSLTVESAGVRRDGGVAPVEAFTCNPGCEATFRSVCFKTDDLLLLETDEGLLQFPSAARTLCGDYVSGVDPAQGVALQRRGAPRPSTVHPDARAVLAALDARARLLARCNPGTTPLELHLTLRIAPSGLVSSLDAGPATTCLAEPLSKLVFAGSAQRLSVTWTLPAP